MTHTKEIKATVPSLRLDVVVGAGFGCSRSRAARYIKEGLVEHRGRTTKSPSEDVKEGDELVLKDKGRCILVEVGGETKKGRTKILLRRMMGKEG